MCTSQRLSGRGPTDMDVARSCMLIKIMMMMMMMMTMIN